MLELFAAAKQLTFVVLILIVETREEVLLSASIVGGRKTSCFA